MFYVWDLDDSTWVVPDSIYTGQAYWFKHIYENPVPFSSDSGMAIPLEPYTINLKNGWNMVGSPFAFPVEVSADPNEVSALYSLVTVQTETAGHCKSIGWILGQAMRSILI